MRDYTSFHIGGACKRMVWPKSEEELAKILSYCDENGLPLYLVGNGSNLLVADEGIDGVVVQLGARFSGIRLEEGNLLVCEAGATLAKVCVFAREHSLTGLEFAYGIPGSVGGAAYMNAGAYGGEMKDVVAYCEHIAPDGTRGRLSGDELGFSYRHSAYCENGFCVSRVAFRLQPGDPKKIAAAMEDYMTRRKTKQPLEFPSAGSTFKRPEGNYASALIDQCGLKGVTCGGAQVSEKHAGFVINAGGATCADVLNLMDRVRDEVEKQTGYRLEPEVKMIP